MFGKQDFLSKYGPPEHLHKVLDNNDPDSAYWDLLGSHSIDQSHVDRMIKSKYSNIHELALEKTNNPEHMQKAVDSNDHYKIDSVTRNPHATPEALGQIIRKHVDYYSQQHTRALKHPNLSREDALGAIHNKDPIYGHPLQKEIIRNNKNLTHDDLSDIAEKHPHLAGAVSESPNFKKSP